MRILVIGGRGMAGHLLLQYLTGTASYELFHTTRETTRPNRIGGLYLDALDSPAVEKLVEAVRPDVIVNCAGILNDAARRHELDAYRINGLLPHLLAGLAERVGGRLIHISTDCVFSGCRGKYEERHVPDGTSVYAKTKALGEIFAKPHVTIRTSIIGPEIRSHGIGLLHWFMQQQGVIKGFLQVPWNGVTTLELAKFIHYLLGTGSPVTGLVHLTAAETVSKHELLHKFRRIFGKTDVDIQPDDAIVLDRTLRSTRTDITGYTQAGYDAMLAELRDWMRAE
ncbi:dTDP-4-dehydrorhamnose reductase family protein [Paenibacillus piri]|uniref:dTDP-4-dehydrorhamnose reductase n=1 Tax=Paenibacillus piri TaxID=2547395 RepID=A0A4R5KPQ8_9BACL|nr:SDR family oxidoreductase [Paenibacillus piri]TDF97566.1 SDR family oxidoreductase [Paenibacillus piri]